MDFWELMWRITSFWLGALVGGFAVFLIGVGIGGLQAGIPFVASFFLFGVLIGLGSLGLFQYAFTGEYAPPWGWWWHRD